MTIQPTKHTKKHKREQMKTKILYADESYAIDGTCFNVYRKNGLWNMNALFCKPMKHTTKYTIKYERKDFVTFRAFRGR